MHDLGAFIILQGLYNRGIKLTNLFGNICYLRMHMSFVDDLVPSMVFLFGGMPILSTLYLKSTPPLLDLGSNVIKSSCCVSINVS